jgi:hypothetical protein
MKRGHLFTLLVSAATFGAGYCITRVRDLDQPSNAVAAEPRIPPNDSAGSPSSVSQMKLFGGMGKERVLEPGKQLTLLEQPGTGTLTHMWFGGSWSGWGGTRIRVYVDSEERPGIEFALFMGHGVGWDDETAPWGTSRMGKTGHPSGVFNSYKIPFGNGIKMTAELAPEVHQPQTFWWITRGVTNYPLHVGHLALPPTARLRLHRKEHVQLKPLDEIEILNTQHSGLLYCVALAASSGNFNYLEACLRAYPDESREPIFLSSGTEDYFLGTYYFNAGRYHLPMAGLTHLDADQPDSQFRFSAYRFHEEDPVPFARGLRLVWRNGEQLEGHRFGDPKPTTLTSYVWTYEW